MKNKIRELKHKILSGQDINLEEALEVINIEEENKEALEELFIGANEIRKKFNGDIVDLCTIMNVKSGRCSEDCKYCAQSIHYKTGIDEFSLLDEEEVLKEAKINEGEGANKFSLVSSGRGIINESEFEKLLKIYKRLKKETKLHLCASHGIITYDQAVKLKEAGVEMYHHNIESCENFYKNICSTHSYEDRINTIKNVKKAGLKICSGGILGLGESREERVKMAFELKELGVNSIPLNILTPIKGTPFESNEKENPIELIKTMAVFRYINPKIVIRYAGGRMQLKENQRLGLKAGINGALTGNFLTTIGSTIESDKKMIESENLKIIENI